MLSTFYRFSNPNRIYEKLQTASDESYKETSNLQAKIQKHHAFEAEVRAHKDAIGRLDADGLDMIAHQHFASSDIRRRLDELHRLWQMLLGKLEEKGIRLQEALKLVHFLRQYDEVMFWIKDRESFLLADELGRDLEHVEMLQKNFEEFQKDLATEEQRVQAVLNEADQLVEARHPDTPIVEEKKATLHLAWARLRELALAKEQKLFGAHEIQRFNRDADETLAWIAEKDSLLSADDHGRDLTSVQVRSFLQSE